MKLKITAKDLTIFIVFCIFLLYFSAIAVLNVLGLLNNDGDFHIQLLPFEAFTPRYLFGTLFVFVAVLVAIFFSVSSTIFERKSGFGFEIGDKESKGYSRWLKEKEMKKAYKVYKVGVRDETATVGGVVFINDGKNMWVDDSENHTLVIGVTGAGKTTAVVDPLIYSLCKNSESMVITDPKGEIYKNHAELLKARGYKIIVLNFRNPNLGNAWNPLTLPYQLYKAGNVDKAVELVDDVALNILQDKKAQDPFWEKSASDYFSGCALGLMEDAKEEEVNLNSISLMTTVGEEKFGAGSTYIKEYFLMKGEQSSPYIFASNTINSPTETKGGILSVFRQKIRLFASREMLSEMLAYSDFNMRDIGKEKTAVFMVIHDEKTTYHALATIFIKQCYETLIDVAQECGGKLPYRTNFILDEFANMPPLKDVTTMVTAARSRSMRFTFIIQNFAQLNEVYGKEDAETIRSNCGNLVYLLTTELAALEEISKLCGEVECKKDDKVATKPLISVSDLQKLKMNEVIILRNRYHPFRTKLRQGFDTDWGDKEFGKAEFIERDTQEIQMFDVKEFVKVRKRSKMGIDEKSSGGPDFSSIMGGGFGGMAGGGTPPRIPTFEEFMAARNANKANKQEEPKKNNLPNFNVDDLVKRIDAKIAELEAQEKEEEKKAKEGNTTDTKDTPTDKGVEVENIEKLETLDKDKVVSPEITPQNIGFNPFNSNNNENVYDASFTDKNKDDDNNLEKLDSKEMDSSNINKFDDLINKTSPVMPEAKPSIMINNPIDEVTKVPELPQEPMLNNELKGIEDLMKTTIHDNIKNNNENIVVNNSSDILDNKVNMVNEIPVTPVQTSPKVIQTQTVQTVNTNSTPNVKVDTESVVIPPASEDSFFDDFFEEN